MGVTEDITLLKYLFEKWLKEAYLDKFKTSARVRPFEEQKHGVEFFKREHSKPHFTKHSVMNVRNLFVYNCSN